MMTMMTKTITMAIATTTMMMMVDDDDDDDDYDVSAAECVGEHIE